MMSIYALAHERNENSMRGSGYTHSCELNLDYTKYSQASKQTNKQNAIFFTRIAHRHSYITVTRE